MYKRAKIISLVFLAIWAASCSTPEKHLRKGDMFYSHGEYYDAAAEYKQAYSMAPRKDREMRGRCAFLMGECYRRINNSAKAEGAYRNAVRYEFVDTTTYLRLADMQRISGNYKQARANYELYLNLKPDDKLALAGIQSCDLAPEMKERGSTYTVHPVALFTSRRADYCPVLFGEKSDQLVFTSTRPQAVGDDDSPITGMKNGDLFYTAKDDKGKWKPVEPLEGSVNTALDEGACCISPDGQTMYLTVCPTDPESPRYAEIHTSSRADASWSKPQKLTITGDTLSSFAHPAVSPDGRWLYFVSDMPGGLGGLDIWRCELGGHGVGAVENLGAPINSEGDEEFPTFRPNGDLYFSSNGHPGMGGLDLFVAHHDTVADTWRVEILPAPVNSSGDDFGMTFEGIHNRGYFSSNRKNGRGWDHIYSFEKPEVVQTVLGYVYEQDGYELLNSTVYMVGNDGTNLKFGVRSDGSFEQQLKPGVKYVMLATCDGFLNYKQEISVDSSDVSTCDTLYFPLPSVNSPVLVRNVFYEFNSAKLTDDSRQALDNLTRLLKDNANVTIELSSHCDYRGNELYNRKLSQHRAESVVNYLIEHGIESDRLTATGYGKLRPKVATKRLAATYNFLHEGDTLTEKFIRKLKPAEQDTCNALNRRTEFRVLKTTYGLLDNAGNISGKALLSGKPATKTAKKEPVVKVYVPTPAEAAAADGKKLPAAKPAAKVADKKAATAQKTDTAKSAKPAAAKTAAAKTDKKAATAQKTDTAKTAKPAAAKTAAAKTDKKASTAQKTETAKAAKPAAAKTAAAKTNTKAATAQKTDTAKAAKPATAKTAAAKTNTKPATAQKTDTAKAAKPAAAKTAAAKTNTKTATKQKTDTAKAAKPAAAKTAAAKTNTKAATAQKTDTAKAAKPAAAKTATAKTDKKTAVKQKADSAKAAKAAKDKKTATSKDAKADSKSKKSEKKKSAKVATAASATAAAATSTVAAASKTTAKAAKTAAASAAGKVANKAVKTTATSSKSSKEAAAKAKAAEKAKKKAVKAAEKAAKKKAKAEAKAKADSLKLAKKKARAAEKAKAKAAKEAEAKAKAAAKAKAKAESDKKTASAKTSVRKERRTSSDAAATKTAAKAATATETKTAAKTATISKPAATSARAKAATTTKATTKPLTAKEKKALQDSIIAKAKRDAEAEKAKQQK